MKKLSGCASESFFGLRPAGFQGDVKVALNSKHEARNPKQIQNSNVQNSKQKQHVTMLSGSFRFGHLKFGHSNS
jgi:hypothetical protein